MREREHLDLRYFTPKEYRDWWPQMSLRLLVLVDVVRGRSGMRWQVSPVEGALGRRLGRSEDTQHNVERWGEVRAGDYVPAAMTTRSAAERIVEIGRESGLTGIGIYPHWRPRPGVHLDVRIDREPGDPEVWGGVRRDPDDEDSEQIYVSLEEALEAMPDEDDEG